MDSNLNAAICDNSFGSTWRPGTAVETGKKQATGRRGFFRRGTLAAASASAVSTAGKAFAGNPNYLPSLYLGENVREFQAIQEHENAHVEFLVNALGTNARPKPSFVDLTQPNLLTFAPDLPCAREHGRWSLPGCRADHLQQGLPCRGRFDLDH